MKVLSLFDGMSCGRIALERAGINVTSYHASELDDDPHGGKYAAEVSKANYPDIIRLGDVTLWREWGIDWKNIDLLIGGSPCQGFSFAGKQLAFDDPRSKLFFVYVDILKHIRALNPNVKFLLENVMMEKSHIKIISDYLEVNPAFINSKIVSAHTRPRLYWANWGIPLPKDKGLLLKDIQHQQCPSEKYYLSKKILEGFNRKIKRREHLKSGFDKLNIINPDKKISCLTARYHKTAMSDPFVSDQRGVRRLTPVECERAQTVPDNYTNHVSNTQRYKMLGNGWTVDVIVHIFKNIESKPPRFMSQLDMFADIL
jgi:site-specific DNA-cytosine methylase